MDRGTNEALVVLYQHGRLGFPFGEQSNKIKKILRLLPRRATGRSIADPLRQGVNDRSEGPGTP